jgi:hypothetical protein
VRLDYSRFFETHALDHINKAVHGLLAAVDDKRIDVCLHAAANAQAARTFKQPTLSQGDEGNPDIPFPRPDKISRTRITRRINDKRDKDNAHPQKKPEHKAWG